MALVVPGSSSSASVVAESITPPAGATATAPVSWSPPKRCAAAGTRTSSMDCVSKSVPSKRSVSVASVGLVLVAEAMERPAIGGVVASAKPAGETPWNTLPASSTTTRAPFRLVSISAGGVVLAMLADAAGTVAMKVSVSRSVASMLLSLSDTVTVTVETPAAVGAPHTVRSSAQSGRPKDSPAGSPLAA